MLYIYNIKSKLPVKRCFINKVSQKKHLMMVKKQSLLKTFVAKHTDSISYRRIPELLNVPLSTVGAIMRGKK